MIRLCRTLVSIVFVISILAIILIVSPGINAHAQEANDFAGGNGTEEDPYLVATTEHLDNVRKHMDAHFKQIADIDLSEFTEGEGWVPIGFLNPWGRSEGFTGSYDGNGFRISNLTIEKPDFWAIGMFGYLEGNAILKNITLENVNVAGWMVSGGLVGLNGPSDDEEQNPSIENCSVNGKVVVSDTSGVVGGLVGGLVGGNYGQINGCLFTGKVEGERTTGGLVGVNENGNITDSFAEGEVSGDSMVGGLVGVNEKGIISRSYFSGKVISASTAGGLIGDNQGIIERSYVQAEIFSERGAGGLVGHNSGKLRDCYVTGHIFAKGIVGGLAMGNARDGDILSSYASVRMAGMEQVGGLAGRNDGNIVNSFYDRDIVDIEFENGDIPKFTEEMMQRDTFEGWDFTDTWSINEDQGYPYLRWQKNNIPTPPEEKYCLHIKTRGQGNINPGVGFQTYVMGDRAKLTASPAEGWEFIHWELDGIRVEEEPGITLDSPVEVKMITLIANFTGFAGGSGSNEDPFLVETAAQLDNVRYVLDGHYKQTADIDMIGYSKGYGWEPIGYRRSDAFEGTYNGNGFEIINLTINRTEPDPPLTESRATGLFGYLSGGSEVVNVVLRDVDIAGTSFVGGVAGLSLNRADIRKCSVTGAINGGVLTGGLVGYNRGDIRHSFSESDVTGTNSIGGLTSINRGNILDSYSTGKVVGRDIVGGLVSENAGEIIRCYAACQVEGEEHVGGIVGQNEGAVEDSYYDKDVAGLDDGPGKPKSTEEMMQRETFANWDFEEIWAIDEGEKYPYLKWERQEEKNEDVN